MGLAERRFSHVPQWKLNMKSAVNLIAVLALVVFSANAVAQETSGEAKVKKECASHQSVAAKADDDKKGQCASHQAETVVAVKAEEAQTCGAPGCPVSEAMAKLPKMTYMVGTESACCAESAKELAEKSKEPVKFVVGDKKFDDKEKAYVLLVEQTEAHVDAFIKPSKCEASGTHTVAGKSATCPVEAGKNASLVKKAVEKVSMTYVVGKESCSCAKMAGELAKKSGEKMTYKVGEEATCCSMEARLKLAHAKYKAAVQAMVAAEKPAETAGTSGT